MALPSAADGKGLKRKGLADLDGTDSFKSMPAVQVQPPCEARRQRIADLATNYSEGYAKAVAPEDKPFLGAQPLLLKHPAITPVEETERVTAVACRTIEKLIQHASGVDLRIGDVLRESAVCKELLEAASDEHDDVSGQPVVVGVLPDVWQTMPFTDLPRSVGPGKRLVICIGAPGKYLTMCIKSYVAKCDLSYDENRLVVLSRGACMLPLGTQEQNIFGVDEDVVFHAIVAAVKKIGVTWGHGSGTKASIMNKVYGYQESHDMPETLKYTGDVGGGVHSFDYLVDYVKYLNQVKLAKPVLPVTSWYDTGLLVSVLQGSVVEAGVSLLTDSDGLAMLRDASIGHIISKLNQVVSVEPYSTNRGVYNFFIGDGACRLNGGMELTMHLIESYDSKSMTTLFIFNNHKWAIEDNLVAGTFEAHHLYNKGFYDTLGSHEHVVVCENDAELRHTLALLSRRTDAYVKGTAGPTLNVVVIRGLSVDLPPVLGDIEPIMKSPEMKFMCDVLGPFASGCQHKVPLYGCSAFEYIQYLHLFLEKKPEGNNFQYICGRTDIQAAHMCGFAQPDGKCVLFINDVYGINSLGESLRNVMATFGGKQLLIMIWHPSLTNLIDHFHLHRPPMVWPNIGPELCKYYVRKESDALFIDFAGASSAPRVTEKVNSALGSGMPLVVVNILPEQERAYVKVDVRIKTPA